MTWSGLGLFALLSAHIASGGIALLSGLVAMASRKTGSGIHRAAGTCFVHAMSVMAVSAAVLTILEPDRLSLGAATWAFYLVHTSRSAAMDRLVGLAGWHMFVGVLATGLFLHGGVAAWSLPGGEYQGTQSAGYFVFGAAAMLALLFDLSLRWRPGLSARQRIARHLWRMVTAYFLAATSLFLGQQDDVFPFMAGSPVLLAPSLLTLGFLIFWIVRVRFARNWMGSAAPGRTLATNLKQRDIS